MEKRDFVCIEEDEDYTVADEIALLYWLGKSGETGFEEGDFVVGVLAFDYVDLVVCGNTEKWKGGLV